MNERKLSILIETVSEKCTRRLHELKYSRKHVIVWPLADNSSHPKYANLAIYFENSTFACKNSFLVEKFYKMRFKLFYGIKKI